mmetsp:Transcript_21970/g.28870  ORF Transcript_21970/g.28870 Transcript_21970/m.28870 type:complete len:281 (+) Transcript_21970:127-969(+)
MILLKKKTNVIIFITILHFFFGHAGAFMSTAYLLSAPHTSIPKTSFVSPLENDTSQSLSLNSLAKTSSLRRSSVFFSTKINDVAVDSSVPSTMTEAVNRFFFGTENGPRIILVLITGMVTSRISVGSFTMIDTVLFLGTTVFWWFQEHFLHQKLLHSQTNWIGKEIHQSHHDNSYFSVSIDPAPLMVGWLLVATLVFRAILPEPLSLTASIAYACAGMFYEWTHYFVHTRVKPPNEFWKRVRDHHVRHHRVNSNFWFGFSLPMVDDFFGTNPPISKARRK